MGQMLLPLVGSEILSTGTEPDEKSRILEIKNLHSEIVGHFKMSLEKAVRIGEILFEQKERLRYGEFSLWLENNMPFSKRTARNYMRLFKERSRLKTENVSDLSGAYDFLRRISWSGHKGMDGEKEKRTFLKLSVDGIQNEIIMTAVDKSKEMLETGSTARALEHIAFDWLELCSDESELIPIDAAKKRFEKVYNVTIIIEKQETKLLEEKT